MNAVTLTSAFPATVQPGIPKLGEKPEGWIRAPLGRFLHEVRRPIKMADEERYRLVTVKRARGGVIERDCLLGKEISVKSQFLLEPGDFLISKRQIVHGACGLVPEDLAGSIVSNEYAVLDGSDEIDLRFLNFLAHSVFFQQTCFHSSIGVHIEKMIFKLDRWLRWEFDLPPLPEQRKIAEILSTWDKAIETTEALLATARTQKRTLMQSLLTGKRRFPEFEGEAWVRKEFGEAFTTANEKKTQVNKRDYLDRGRTPVVDQGKEFIVGFTDHEQTYDDVPVVIFGDHTREVKWVDFSFCPGADGTQLLKTKPGLELKYGYYLLEHLELPNLGYSRHMRELKQSVFEVPVSLVEQSKVVATLDVADDEIRLLATDIEKLRTEKKALMQQLLTGKRRVTI